jgi:hypothetical protein
LRCDRPSEGTGLMSFADKLYETAVRLAKYAQSSAAALEEELLQLEMRNLMRLTSRISVLQTFSRYAGPTFNVPAAGLITEQSPTSR